MAIALTACAAAAAWLDRLDITLGAATTAGPGPAPAPPGSRPDAPGTRDLMVCLVDGEGLGRCHHRDGVVKSTVTPQGAATCAGAGARLHPVCTGQGACVLAGVPVPSGPFGLLVLSVRRPVFGVPRHGIADAAILTREPGGLAAPARSRLAAALAAVARCLAPGDAAGLGAELPVVALAACTARACDLGRVSLRFASRDGISMANP